MWSCAQQLRFDPELRYQWAATQPLSIENFWSTQITLASSLRSHFENLVRSHSGNPTTQSCAYQEALSTFDEALNLFSHLLACLTEATDDHSELRSLRLRFSAEDSY